MQFPFLSTQEGLSSKFFFFFPPELGGGGVEDDIQGRVHAEQVCHQLSYIPSPVKLLKKNRNLEASQTFPGHQEINSLLKLFER